MSGRAPGPLFNSSPEIPIWGYAAKPSRGFTQIILAGTSERRLLSTFLLLAGNARTQRDQCQAGPFFCVRGVPYCPVEQKHIKLHVGIAARDASAVKKSARGGGNVEKPRHVFVRFNRTIRQAIRHRSSGFVACRVRGTHAKNGERAAIE